MADTYRFTGPHPVGYYAYTDTSTGQMLAAEPRGTYSIRATEANLPVPPADGWWEPAELDAGADAGTGKKKATSTAGGE